MKESRQSIWGRGNVQVSINNVNFNTTDVYKGVTDLFNNLDNEMNKLFPDKVEYSKLDNVRSEFKSTKIFTSLVKVGIPFGDAFQIVCEVVYRIFDEYEDANEEKKKELSTQKIRKIVQNTILTYNGNDVSKEEVEKWADKYVRKYGRNNQKIEVYFSGLSEVKNVDYAFVKGTLLEDIFEELRIRDNAYKGQIPANQIKAISEEIIEFVNDCSIYKVNYDTLKQFVIEMALQPPHPWFVTNGTAKRICEYDLSVLKRHYNKLCNAIDKGDYSDLSITIYEAIHHSCSSILARYHEVLGCKDLDVFYNLERIITKLFLREEEDLLLENYIISNLPNDLRYISVGLQEFLELLRRIKRSLNIAKSNLMLEKKMIIDIIQLCDIAKALDYNVDKEDVSQFLQSNWIDIPSMRKRECIKKIFQVIEGLEVANFITECPNCFWIKKSIVKTGKEIFAICVEESMDCQQIFKFMHNRKAILNTEYVFLVVEEKQKREVYEDILNMLDHNQFYIEIVSKEDLQKIFMSNGQYKEFCKILNRGLYS